MKLADILSILGAIFLALGPELKTEGKTESTWWLGRVMQAVGAALVSSRAVQSLSKPTQQ